MAMKRFWAGAFSAALLLVTIGCAWAAAPEAQAAPPPEIQPAEMTPEYLQQLVAPIALYPDELVAQALAASTYPTEIVEANRWLQQHSNLKGAELGNAINQERWDPSVKALTQFPSVLANMDKNLSWTSALGDAYFNGPEEVMNAVQALRKRAQAAGTLKSTAQQKVTPEGQTIIIEPANAEVVYVPAYNPWIVYGAPIPVYPAYFAGAWSDGPLVFFDVGSPIAWGFDFDWGWHAWRCDWRGRFIVFNHNRFVSRSPTFFHHGAGFRPGGGFRGRENGFHGEDGRPGPVDHRANRGFAAPHVAAGNHPGAFHGFEHGGLASQHSFRGQSSLGGAMHGGGLAGGVHGGSGGGMHGAGGHR
jgi:hypothetical protein